MSLKKVRMLHDHPPGAPSEAAGPVVFRAGAVRDVDVERCARLIADGQAEELPEGWEPPKATPAPASSERATERPARRGGRKGA